MSVDPFPPNFYPTPAPRGPFVSGEDIQADVNSKFSSWKNIGKQNRQNICHDLISSSFPKCWNLTKNIDIDEENEENIKPNLFLFLL